MRQSMLTTLDNPFDPFTQFDEWYDFDESKGYHSCSYLARIAKTSDELSEADEEKAIELAIDEIVKETTTIIIAHRLSTVQNANRIIVLNEGKIVEEGNHQQLMNLQGI